MEAHKGELQLERLVFLLVFDGLSCLLPGSKTIFFQVDIFFCCLLGLSNAILLGVCLREPMKLCLAP